MRKGHCHVADGDCTAAPGIRTAQGVGFLDPAPVTECALCGEEVCTSCSRRVTIAKRRARYCNPCIQREND